VDTKGPDPIDFENGYVAFEDLPADQRHLPGEGSEKKKRNPLEDILGALDDDLDEDDEDDDDEDDEEDDEDEDRADEEAVEVYDGTEELTL
jgi:hypothetical protein